jgi:hypothetical protein
VRRAVHGLVLGGYTGLAILFFGRPLLPHPGRAFFGGVNAPIYIWSFGWWLHALSTWTNPLYSHALYAPGGVNIAWTPSAPGLALAFAPVTALLGPIVSYNVASVLMPALAAWTCYLLCHYLTRSVWASLIGGYLFGFSTAAFRQVVSGNINLTSVFLFPLFALVVLRHLRGELSARGLAWRLGLLLAVQLTLSTEFTLLVTIVLAVALALAYWLVRDQRTALRSSLPPIAAAYALSVLFAAPFAYYLLFHFESGTVVDDIDVWGTDVLAAVSPGPAAAISGTDPLGLSTHVSSRSAYLGLPTLVILGLYVARSWRAAGTRFLAAAFAAAFVATLGATLVIYGHTLFRLPWWTAARSLPALRDMIPFRIGIVEALVAAIAVALWTARTRGRVFARPYVLPILAVVAIVPAFWSSFVPAHPRELAFFTDRLYKQCLAPGDTVVVYGDPGNALIWQAQAGFSFNLAQNGLQPFQKYGTPLNRFDRDPLIWELSFISWAHPTMERMLAFAGAHSVARVVAVSGSDFPNRRQMRRYGPTQLSGGAIIAPACGQPPLTTRRLTRVIDRWETDPQSFDNRPHIGWCYGPNYLALATGLVPPADPGNRHAYFIEGTGLTCEQPPPGFVRNGFAPSSLGVPAGVYPYFAPRRS